MICTAAARCTRGGWGRKTAAFGAKNRIFFRVFPMFVPSLSWQNDRFYILMAQKCRFSQWSCEGWTGWAGCRPRQVARHYSSIMQAEPSHFAEHGLLLL